MNNTQLVQLARIYCKHFHKWQYRKWNNLPYCTHPIKVCDILIKYWYWDYITQCIALLHDVVEDTELITWEIKDRFWYEIANWVYILSKNTIRNDTIASVWKVVDQNGIVLTNDQLYKTRLSFARRKLRRIKIADMIHNTEDLSSLKQDSIDTKISDAKNFYIPMWIKVASLMVKELEGNINNFLDKNKK